MRTKAMLLSIGLLTCYCGVVAAQQPDTITDPSNKNVFRDPKTTNDRSKVLIDTSTQVVDSLMDARKQGRDKNQKTKGDAMGESKKSVKIKRSPVDSTKRTVVP
jgi:hypothetical protein